MSDHPENSDDHDGWFDYYPLPPRMPEPHVFDEPVIVSDLNDGIPARLVGFRSPKFWHAMVWVDDRNYAVRTQRWSGFEVATGPDGRDYCVVWDDARAFREIRKDFSEIDGFDALFFDYVRPELAECNVDLGG